jgi:enamine deaminase RidA (YjgF/YER057c/UK114 family)
MKAPALACALLLSASAAVAQTRAAPALSVAKQKFNLHPGETEYGYAQAVLVGNTLYISGTVHSGTMPQQISGIYTKLEQTLNHYGLTFANVVKETVYAVDLDGFSKAQSSVRKQHYQGDFPAATWVEVKRLLMPSALVEIELVAVKP